MIDKNILMALETNCRVSYRTLADRLGVTSNAIKKRVRKLVDSGVIVQFIVELSLAMIDAELLMAEISTDGFENAEALIERIGANPMVRTVYQLADGRYFAIAEVVGAQGLFELGRFLRGFEAVSEVEMHTIIQAGRKVDMEGSKVDTRGRKIDFTPQQLRVLHVLREDARMRVAEIAKRTGLTAAKVRRVLQQLIDGGGVHFTVRWNLSAGESIVMEFRITWDETSAASDDIVRWLQEEFPLNFWFAFTSASRPTMITEFVVNHLREAEEISSRIKRVPFVKSVDTMVVYPPRKFPGLSHIRLDEMLAEINL
jgi:DNA-binding Lrp family transcriptional regulator